MSHPASPTAVPYEAAEDMVRDPIPFALPSIGTEEETAVIEVLRSGWLTTGRVAARFEAEFAEAVGARYGLAVNSATSGLHLALEASGVRSGDAVITTPYTFTATAEVVRYLGADPAFVDVDAHTLNIDPERIAEALDRLRRLGRRVSAVLPVHFGGKICDMPAIVDAAGGIPIVEDAAHAFPARLNGRAAGTFGAAGVFSFYATKTITTGEGGMVVTDDERIAQRMRTMRLHGIDREVWNRYTGTNASWQYEVVEAGYKYNMTDLAAALGRAQLTKAVRFQERRAEIAQKYLAAFSHLHFLETPADGAADHSWHLFTLRIAPGTLRIGRDEFVRALMERGIGASVHYIPLHIMPYYRRRYGFEPGAFPNAWSAYQRIFSIPIYPGLSDDQVERVIDTVVSVGNEHRR